MRQNRLVILLLAVIIVMAAEIIFLMYQNHQMQAMLENPTKLLRTLQPEQSVPTIRGQDIDGAEVALRYSAEQPFTLLMWFSAGCNSCRDNFSYWNSLHDSYASPELRMIGFCAGSLDEARQVRTEQGIAFPVLSITDQFLTQAYKGNVLPQTILISPEGIVQHVWPGQLLSSQKEEIINTLSGLSSHADKGGDQQ